MGNIKKLSRNLVAKIAAGEVIERPASVVKELVENSIDAEADDIKVYVKNAGKDEIKITDNGIGMDKADLKMSIERHATSKIHTEDELYSIKTMGFRGEALASIASVSKITIITKRKEDSIGTKYISSEEKKITETAASEGTTIIVKDLFYNTPARKKYLKSEATEFKHISDIMTNFALAYPNISFKLYKNNKLVFQAPKGIDTLSRISYVYNDYIARNLLPIQFENEFLKIKGYIGKPTAARESSDYQTVFINNRFVKSKLVIDAAMEAYKAMLFLKRKPILILKLFLDPKRIDVNVHPSKLEVKFDNEQLVYFSVHEAVKKALENSNLIEKRSRQAKQPFGKRLLNRFKAKEKKAKYPMEKEHNQVLIHSSEKTGIEEGDTSHKVSKDKEKSRYRVLGQIHKTYIVAESEEGLILVDQHAAHERINYEKIRKEFYESKVESQGLIKPVVISLGKGYEELVEQNKDYLRKLGFEIDHFGKDEFLIRSIPSVLKGTDENEINIIVEKILDSSSTKKPQDLIDERNLFTIACRKSIKAGDELNENQIKSLLKELFECNNPYTCPHGRPTVVEMDEKELEKLFKRTV